MSGIRSDIVAALITSVLLGIVGYSLGYYENKEVSQLVVPALIVLLVVFVFFRFYRPLLRTIILWGTQHEIQLNGSDQQFRRFKEVLTKLVDAPSSTKLLENTGLVGWYTNFDDCNSRLRELVSTGSSVKLLTYIGKSDVGKGTDFYEAIAHNRRASMKVLLCSPSSSFVSPQFAEKIGHNKDRAGIWQQRILQTLGDLRNLHSHHGIDIHVKLHNLPFVWRLWFVDDVLLVSAMMYYKGEDNSKVPVYEIRRSADRNNKQLYEMFEQYFDLEWARADDEK